MKISAAETAAKDKTSLQKKAAGNTTIEYKPLEEVTEVEKKMFDNSLKIDINTAVSEELTTVDGVGVSTAEKIIKYREKNGHFMSLDELAKVSGIGENKITLFRESFTVKIPDNKKIEQRENTQTAPSKIDLNSADISTLQTVKGIGENFAQKIIDYREENNGFKSPDDLLKISGVGQKKIDKIIDFITIGKFKKQKIEFLETIQKINLNESSYNELRRIPGITPKVGKAIVKFRDKSGFFNRISDLKKVDGIDLNLYVKIKKYFYLK